MTIDERILSRRRQGYTRAEIASVLEISQARVDMALEKAPRRLQYAFADMGAGEPADYSLNTRASRRGQD